ncbi:MAG: DUF4296 domain-containing protein [Calditrichaceae bacterium]
MIFRKINYVFIGLTIFFTIFLSTCSSEQKKNLSKDKFSSVLAEISIIENLAVEDTEKMALIKNLFKKYNTTPDEFIRTIEANKKNSEYWIDIYKRTSAIIKEKSDPE